MLCLSPEKLTGREIRILDEIRRVSEFRNELFKHYPAENVNIDNLYQHYLSLNNKKICVKRNIKGEEIGLINIRDSILEQIDDFLKNINKVNDIND